jgi:hypothetical protein
MLRIPCVRPSFHTVCNVSASDLGTNNANGFGFAEHMAETQSETRRLGYARVSTYGQTLDAQLDQLRAEGCAKVYREKASGAQADRRQLQRMLKAVAAGDVVTVTRIDRLARSTFDLFAVVKRGVACTSSRSPSRWGRWPGRSKRLLPVGDAAAVGPTRAV